MTPGRYAYLQFAVDAETALLVNFNRAGSCLSKCGAIRASIKEYVQKHEADLYRPAKIGRFHMLAVSFCESTNHAS
jgi:hypothetical protein